MLEINANNNNAIVRYNGKPSVVIRYDEDYLRKYSELYLYGWPEDKIVNELREDIETELMQAFPDEEEHRLVQLTLFLLTYAKANIHDPRKTKGGSYKVVFEYADGRKGSCIEDGKVKLFDTEQEAADFASGLNILILEGMKPVFPVYRVEKA